MGVVLPLQAGATMPGFHFRLMHDVEIRDEAGVERDDLHAPGATP